jgi:hypothetical protein
MKPENNGAVVGPELQQVPPTSSERIPTLPTPEGGIESGAERVEQTAEARAKASDAAATGAPVVPVIPDPSVATTPVVSDDSPVVAADDDVIEKEWVDKAKKIIIETKDDPHTRSTRVNNLQKDYLQKRYGKVIGASE